MSVEGLLDPIVVSDEEVVAISSDEEVVVISSEEEEEPLPTIETTDAGVQATGTPQAGPGLGPRLVCVPGREWWSW